MQILRILKHFIFIRKTIFFNNRHTYLHSSARSLRPLTVICLPRERRCGKHLQRMLDKCTGGGIKWPRAVYSSLLHKVVAKTFCIFCRVIWIFANLAETLTAWFQSIKVASFVKKNNRSVTWLLQSGMDCLLISDFHPLSTPSNAVWKLAFSKPINTLTMLPT